MILESFGNILGLGVAGADEDVEVSLQEIIPSNKMKPTKYFMPKKYSFSRRLPSNGV